jgi:hypothetical protein
MYVWMLSTVPWLKCTGTQYLWKASEDTYKAIGQVKEGIQWLFLVTGHWQKPHVTRWKRLELLGSSVQELRNSRVHLSSQAGPHLKNPVELTWNLTHSWGKNVFSVFFHRRSNILTSKHAHKIRNILFIFSFSFYHFYIYLHVYTLCHLPLTPPPTGNSFKELECNRLHLVVIWITLTNTWIVIRIILHVQRKYFISL